MNYNEVLDLAFKICRASRVAKTAAGWKDKTVLTDAAIGNEPDGEVDTAVQAWLYSGLPIPKDIKDMVIEYATKVMLPDDELRQRVFDTLKDIPVG